MKKRLLAMLMTGILLLTGCRPEIEQADNEKNIYASFYPLYALSDLILDDIPGIRLKCLVQPQDDCLRLYDLSDWDASVLAYDADSVIIAGNGLESFENALYTFGSDGPAIITATHGLELYNARSAASSDIDTDHFSGINPHAYMSVIYASEMIDTIGKALIDLYPEQTDVLNSSIAAAGTRLDTLASSIDKYAGSIGGSNVILMNEALIYTAMDLKLGVEYIYSRESGTTLYGDSLEAAIEELGKYDAEVILIEKQAPAELVTAMEEAGYKVVAVDIMSSFSYADERSYIDIQLENAAAIAAAFQ